PLATSAKPISSYTICEIKIHHQKLELRHNCSITDVRATVDCLFRAAGDKGGQQDASMVSTAGLAMAGPAGAGRIGLADGLRLRGRRPALLGARGRLGPVHRGPGMVSADGGAGSGPVHGGTRTVSGTSSHQLGGSAQSPGGGVRAWLDDAHRPLL